MTSIAIFRVTHPRTKEKTLWAIGDTRITSVKEDASQGRESIASGAKIFSIPIRITRRECADKGNGETINTSIGFAYAGHTTLGLNLHAQLSQILPNLVAHEFPEQLSVSLLDIVKFSASVLQLMTREINSKLLSPTSKDIFGAEIAIFGYCAVVKDLRVYVMFPKMHLGELVIHSEDRTPEDAISAYLNSAKGYVLLGDKKDVIADLIAARMEDLLPGGVDFSDVELDAAMAPKYVLEAILHHKVFPTIGGGLQLLIADKNDIRLVAWVRPQSVTVPPDQYEWYTLYGYNVTEHIPSIGNIHIESMMSVGPDYDVDASGFDRMTEFYGALARVTGKSNILIVKSSKPIEEVD